jgi:hypothetical protein
MANERRFVMASAIALRSDFDGAALHCLARASKAMDQTRRLLALVAIYDGGRGGAAAELGGVGLQVIGDWVLRFNAEGPGGLIDRKAPGRPPKLDDSQRLALAQRVDDLDPRGVWQLSGREVGEPRIESPGVRQADGPATPPCPERIGHGGI